jgi:hypothetical protein
MSSSLSLSSSEGESLAPFTVRLNTLLSNIQWCAHLRFLRLTLKTPALFDAAPVLARLDLRNLLKHRDAWDMYYWRMQMQGLRYYRKAEHPAANAIQLTLAFKEGAGWGNDEEVEQWLGRIKREAPVEGGVVYYFDVGKE